MHNWKLVDIPTITTYFIHPWVKGLPLYNIVIHFELFLQSNLIFFSFFTFSFVFFCFSLSPTCIYKYKSCSLISIHGFFQVTTLWLFHVKNFKFFILGYYEVIFLFYHVQSFSSSFHCTFFRKIIKHIKVSWCQCKQTWITWRDKFMEFGTNHHTCLLQLHVFFLNF